MNVLSFDEFLATVRDLGTVVREDEEMQALAQRVVQGLRRIGEPTRHSLARFVEEHPESVPIIATGAGLGQEQLKNQLRHRLGTTGWITLARERADELILVLDEAYGLVEQVSVQLAKEWTFSDVLLERHLWSRRHGAGSVGRGRGVEDAVEDVVKQLNLPYTMRTRFAGRGGDTAPADLAIPTGGTDSLIVIGMKGFNSTGSKLTDAVGEIETMARVRLPRQYVYAVVDGIGWINRQADLRRIHSLWVNREIDGLYSLEHLDQLRVDLADAAARLGILQVRPQP